jgi:valyl-tRNA synthetase
VEKRLLKEKGLTRHDLGKEKFLQEVWKFLRTTQATILNQAKKMGGSFDWSREAFTLDEKRKKAVTKMFIEMYEEGLVYRGKRIVNWCPRCKSTLADDEVEYEEELGKLYWIKYGPFVLATSRPETKLGDTAVAVHPSDKRYKKFVGKKYMIPGVLGEFEVQVVADHAVDPKFGTGVIKVTPAHDFTDNEIASRHNLPTKQIIDEEGRMMENCGKYRGLTTGEAREAIVRDMEKIGLIDHVEENYHHNLATCYRCGATIEPIPSNQWFVAVDKKIKRLGGKSLKEKALEVAKNKEIKFIPTRFTKRYTDWMTNLHDWCISRQIWFGHEMPIWYNKDKIYVGEKAPKGIGWKKDEDTFDTWFSSGMWTFSTLGWPENFKNGEKTGDLEKFHPTQVLETGYEIITLWVSRMIMMSLFALGEIPFENVYLHGMILDGKGKKMSKSKGNGIDPLDMIAKFGTDAVRLSLMMGSTPGNDARLSQEKIEGFRNFVTKLWNIYRYSFTSSEDIKLVEKISGSDIRTLSDRWIVSRINEVIKEVENDISKYNFSLAGEKIQKFTWGDLANWYLEIHKLEKNDKVLGYVIDKILKLWHPFMPFVTEKIWQDAYEAPKVQPLARQRLNLRQMLMVEKWPVVEKKLIDKKAEKEFQDLQEMITKIRNIRSSYHIDPVKIINAQINKNSNQEIIEKFGRIKFGEKIEKGIQVSGKNISIILDIAKIIDVKKEKEKLQKEIANLENLIFKTNALLANKKFLASAPKEIIDKNNENILEYKTKLKGQKELFSNLENL